MAQAPRPAPRGKDPKAVITKKQSIEGAPVKKYVATINFDPTPVGQISFAPYIKHLDKNQKLQIEWTGLTGTGVDYKEAHDCDTTDKDTDCLVIFAFRAPSIPKSDTVV